MAYKFQTGTTYLEGATTWEDLASLDGGINVNDAYTVSAAGAVVGNEFKTDDNGFVVSTAGLVTATGIANSSAGITNAGAVSGVSTLAMGGALTGVTTAALSSTLTGAAISGSSTLQMVGEVMGRLIALPAPVVSTRILFRLLTARWILVRLFCSMPRLTLIMAILMMLLVLERLLRLL